MAHTSGNSQVQAHSHAAPRRNVLSALVNTDGHAHPLQNTLTGVAFILGAIAIATCAFRGLHMVASWSGLAGVLTAAYAQYISATTAERFIIVIAGGASAVGLGIGLAHGGLY